MAVCGDYGGRTADGAPCTRPARASSRCWQHRGQGKVLSLVPKSDDDPYPVGHLSTPARRAWNTYSAVVPESEWPELYGAILSLNGWIENGTKVAQGDHEDEKPDLQMKRCEEAWLAAKAALKLEERLQAVDNRTELEKLRAL